MFLSSTSGNSQSITIVCVLDFFYSQNDSDPLFQPCDSRFFQTHLLAVLYRNALFENANVFIELINVSKRIIIVLSREKYDTLQKSRSNSMKIS